MTRLSVTGPYEFTELRVLDSQLHEVAGGIGTLDVELDPGIYRVEARVPGAFDKRLVTVPAAGDIRVAEFRLQFDSPAPLPNARTSHETHESSAWHESWRTHADFTADFTGRADDGPGRLFVFLRSDGSPRGRPPLLEVQTAGGERLAGLQQGHNDPDAGFCALSIAMPAGSYVLAHEVPGLGRRGQVIFVEEGWETQLFVPWDLERADFSRALVSMVPGGSGFDPIGQQWRYAHVEAALDGLARGKVVLMPEDEMYLLDPEFDNPMLGLIGAYAYLLRGNLNPESWNAIRRNLVRLLPHSPDAHLLYRLDLSQLNLHPPGQVLPDPPDPLVPMWREFEAPPMFAMGTEKVLELAATDVELVSADSWTARVAATLTTGSVWTRWDLDLDPGQQVRTLLEDTASDESVGGAENLARRSGLPLSVVLRSRKADITVNGGPAPQPANHVGQSWTSGAKDLVMTTLGPSKVWATVARGIITEVYWPSVDQPQIKDFGFLVAGEGWWREVKRVGLYDLSVKDPVLPTATIVHRSARGGPEYRLTLRPVVDPDHDALLISYELEGEDVRLYPLLAPHLGVSQVTDQQWSQLGADNIGRVDLSGDALYASGSGRHLCLLAAPGFARASAGYVGDSDGWTDFQTHGAMQWDYSQAGPGVVALTGELANAAGLLAVGFGDSDVDARAAAQASLDAGYDTVVTHYAASWQNWVSGLKLPTPQQPAGLADALRQSAVVLRSHADRQVAGAYVAGLAIPWGDVTNDPGGYHRVWCRDGGETALALAAAGHTDDALDALSFLASRQSADGSWPRCFFISPPNTYDPNEAVQLDEVAFPLLLAGKLSELGLALPGTIPASVGKAARYLAANGPASQKDIDRWEENPGASPFTLGLEVVAMLVAAQLLTDATDRQLALALADNWNERIEELCYLPGDEIDQYFGTDGHYVRIGSISTVSVHNQPPGTQPLDATTLIGMEFLYLPRLGLRAPNDPRILDTLKIAEAMLGSDTPSGRAYHRYDTDGYGEWLDGSGFPVRNYGIGRPWPLLAGERGHFEVVSNNPPTAQLEAMLAMRGRGGLLPEQIWDADPLPWRQLTPGHPTGSAMPLAWAHSELIKLAVAAQNGRPFEQLKLVTDRYHGTPPVSTAWYWSDNTPVTALPTDRTLVIADTRPFTLHYGFNNWNPNTIREAESTNIGLGLSGVTLTAEELATHDSLQFVRRYQDGWENSSRHDVALKSSHLSGVRFSPAHRARLRASGAAN